MIFHIIRNGLLRRDYVTSRNDGKRISISKYLSLRGAKRRGNLFLMNSLIRCTLSVLLAMTIVLAPCQAAIKFDGVNDGIRMNNSNILAYENAPFTVSVWFYINDFSPNIYPKILTLRSNSATPWELTLSNQAAYLGIAIGSANNWARIKSDTPANQLIGSWQHIVISYNGINPTMRPNFQGYLNNINLSFSDAGGGFAVLANSTNIGAVVGGTSNFFDGLIDEVRIYNRVLSAAEVQSLYNSRSKRPSGSLANGLVAHYEMDDDAIGEITAQAKDSSGNLNHGQFFGFDNLVSNGFSNDVPAQIGTGLSLEFDGVDDYININDTGNLYAFANNTFTVAARVKSNSSTNYCVIAKDGGATGVGWSLFFGNSLSAATKGSEGVIAASRTSISSGLNDDSWHHVVGIYTTDTSVIGNNNVTLYLDGSINQGALTNSAQYVSPTLPTTIGKRSSGNFFPGQIDDVRIYNRALTPSEISFLYNGSGLNPGTSNLQALWTFDEDSTVKDSSGNSNHGVGVGGASLKYTEGVLRR